MLDGYLQSLGFSKKEASIALVLAEIGVQPASVISKRAGLDRVTTYKHLKKLADQGFAKIYVRDGIQCFGLESFDVIEAQLKEKAEKLNELVDRFPTAVNLLKSLRGDMNIIPRLQLFEGESGIRSLFRDMLHTFKTEGIRQIRILNSNTFEEWMGDEPLQKTVRTFFNDIQKSGLDAQIFEVTGALIPEQLHETSLREVDPKHITVVRGTTNVFLLGHTMYLACYKGNQIGLKVQHRELAQIFHFIFDLLGKRQENII